VRFAVLSALLLISACGSESSSGNPYDRTEALSAVVSVSQCPGKNAPDQRPSDYDLRNLFELRGQGDLERFDDALRCIRHVFSHEELVRWRNSRDPMAYMAVVDQQIEDRTFECDDIGRAAEKLQAIADLPVGPIDKPEPSYRFSEAYLVLRNVYAHCGQDALSGDAARRAIRRGVSFEIQGQS